jgi:hypothetical protein
MKSEKHHIYILSEILILSAVATLVVGFGLTLISNSFITTNRFLPYFSNGFVFFVVAIFQLFLMRIFRKKYEHVDPKLVFLFVLAPFFIITAHATFILMSYRIF